MDVSTLACLPSGFDVDILILGDFIPGTWSDRETVQEVKSDFIPVFYNE